VRWNECERHAHTIESARDERTDAHLSECERCRDTATVAGALVQLGRETARLPPPPFDAGAVFRRSQLIARLLGDQTTLERASRPVAFAQVAALALVISGLGWWALAAIRGTGADLAPAVAIGQVSGLLVWPLVLGGMAALATARALWADDEVS
jgi:hypothetical protein